MELCGYIEKYDISGFVYTQCLLEGAIHCWFWSFRGVEKSRISPDFSCNVFYVTEQTEKSPLRDRLYWKSEWLNLNIFHFTHPAASRHSALFMRLILLYDTDYQQLLCVCMCVRVFCLTVSDCGNTVCVRFQGFCSDLLHIQRLLSISNNGFQAAERRLLMFVCVSAWGDLTETVISVLSCW